MKRRVYLITQKNFVSNSFQVISDGKGKLEIFAGKEGRARAEKRIKTMNKDWRKLTVSIKKGWVEF